MELDECEQKDVETLGDIFDIAIISLKLSDLGGTVQKDIEFASKFHLLAEVVIGGHRTTK